MEMVVVAIMAWVAASVPLAVVIGRALHDAGDLADEREHRPGARAA